LANLEELGNLYSIISILDREFHNARGEVGIKNRDSKIKEAGIREKEREIRVGWERWKTGD
jgi:hypothetical protein